MAIHLNKKSGAPVYHRNGEASSKNYSIFGDNGMMNYAYVSSDEDSDSQGHYTMPTKTPEYFNNEELKKKGTSSSSGDYRKKDTTVDRPVILSKNKLSSKKFVWPYGGKNVFLTGTFDDWKGSIQMTPVSSTNIHNNLFYVTVAGLDFSRDILYKFVVDGQWCYDIKRDHVTEASGNINNIIYANSS
ncbi:uncharacterized protein EV154DRAFT_167412 [Mucor mucedo]|uniref:uncharacterized protein n=1 Tax=Mucor mucedo TaxID=29922 RepID=UPI00221E8664|nr:uncharacterized protein EV154DRAFT_167412 [Mucor mucedo]KAI7892885.1 hypothetical protein EV154DRAFT_167412 [Mucor mucedo]